MAKLVKEIMTTEVVSVQPGTTIAKLAAAMVDHNLTGVPVVRKGAVVGMVTDSDLVAQKSNIHAPQFLSALHSFIMLRSSKSVEEEIKKLLGSKAEDIMTSPIVSVRSGETIAKLATLMVETKANPIPVVDNGALVGIVSRHDLLKLIADEATAKPAPTPAPGSEPAAGPSKPGPSKPQAKPAKPSK
ncbi:MAG: CBS domain-containing protein [Candidatus Andersenbacteria bacterium]